MPSLDPLQSLPGAVGRSVDQEIPEDKGFELFNESDYKPQTGIKALDMLNAYSRGTGGSNPLTNSIARGVEGLGQSLYELADYVSQDALPDYDTRLLGESTSVGGGLVEDITQWLIPAGSFKKGVDAVRNSGKISKYLGPDVLKRIKAGGQLTYKESKLLKKKARLENIAEGIAIDAAADFVAFKGTEERLSNLAVQHPWFNNAVTQYLKADEDDDEAEGRLKNVIEGSLIGMGIGALFHAKDIVSTVKMLATKNKKMAKGLSERDAVAETIEELGNTVDDVDYTKIDDPVTGIKGQTVRRYSDDELVNAIESQGLTIDDFVVDDATGQIDLATAGSGGRKATAAEYDSYLERMAKSHHPMNLWDVLPANGTITVNEFVSKVGAKLKGKRLKDTNMSRTELQMIERLAKEVPGAGDIPIGRNIKGVDINKYAERAYYDTDLHKIVVNRSRFTPVRTVLHELIHANSTKILLDYLPYQGVADEKLTGEAYLKQIRDVADGKATYGKLGNVDQAEVPVAVREIADLYLTALDRLGQTSAAIQKHAVGGHPDLVTKQRVSYSFGTIHEFIAEAFSNVTFQRELSSIIITKGGKKVSAYKRFKTLVSKMLGFKPKEASALDEVLSVSTKLFKEQEFRQLYDTRASRDPNAIYNPIDSYDEISVLENIALRSNQQGTFSGIMQQGLGYLSEQASKYGAKLTKAEKDFLSMQRGTEFYRGAPEGHVADALDSAFKGKTVDRLRFVDQVEDIYNKVLRAAREARETSVKTNIKKFDKRMVLRDDEVKLSAKQLESDPSAFDVLDEVSGSMFTIKATDADDAVKQAKDVLAKQKRDSVLESVKSGASLKELAFKEAFEVNISKLKGGPAGSRELTFTNIRGEQVDFRSLPENLKEEAELYLREHGGRVKSADSAKDVPIGKSRKKPDIVPQKDDKGAPKGDKGAPKPQKPRQEPDNSDLPETSRSVRQQQDQIRQVVAKALKDTGPGGGVQALRSILRTVSSDSDFLTIARALVDEHEAFLKQNDRLAKTSREELLNPEQSLDDILENLSGAMGGDPDAIKKELRKLEARGEDMKKHYIQMLKEQQAIRYLNNIIGEEVYNLAKEASDILEKAKVSKDENLLDVYDSKFAQMLQHMEMMIGTQRLWAMYGRFPSLALLQRKYIYQDIKMMSFDHSASDLEQMGAEAIQQYKSSKRGTMSQEKLLALILNAKDANGILQAPLNKIVKESKGKRMFDMVREYFMNSLLSGIPTQQINMIGSLLTYTIRNVERATGALAAGDIETARDTMRFAFNIKAMQDALSMARRAFWESESILIPDSYKFAENPTKRNSIHVDADNAFGQAFNLIGNLIRMPSRGLVTGDEFFKTLSYRTYVMTELAMQGRKQGLQGKQLAEYVYKGVNAHVTETGRVFNQKNLMLTASENADKQGLRFAAREDYIKKYMKDARDEKHFLSDGTQISYDDRGMLAKKAEQAARINTHTQDSNSKVINFLSELSSNNMFVTTVIPFVKTPANILMFGLERSPLGVPLHAIKALSGKYTEILRSGSKMERAELLGKLSMSVATMTTMVYTLMSGDSHLYLSGYGPKDPEKRKAWLKDNQPYSIRVGDKLISYQRLDPFATMLGIIADIADGYRYEEYEEKDLTSFMAVATVAFTRNVTSKSYMSGLDNVVEFSKDPMNKGSELVGNIAGGFVPNFANQMMNIEEDREIKEARTVLDYMIKRTPGLAGKLPPRRDFLGDKEVIEGSGGFWGIANPLYVKSAAKNIVEYEFGHLGAGFKRPSSFLRKGDKDLDMREYYNDNGDQAYDRMLELMSTRKIGGMTLKERLAKVFNSAEYQALPQEAETEIAGNASERVKMIRKIINIYKSAAQGATLDEYPELKKKYLTAVQASRLGL